MSQSLQGSRLYSQFESKGEFQAAPAFQAQGHDHQTGAKHAHSDVKETGIEHFKRKAACRLQEEANPAFGPRE